jgi:NAD(P)H-nitrite reductase large subunit
VGAFVGWVITALGGLASVATLIDVGSERRKIIDVARRTGVDVTRVLANTAVSLMKTSQDQISFLRGELATVRNENTGLRSEIAELRAKVASISKSPAAPPSPNPSTRF